MKVTVCFDNIRVVVPCGDGTLLVKDLMREAILRYKKATGRNDAWLSINSLSSLTGGGLLDPDDRLCDVADDREQIVAHFVSGESQLHVGGDGASSVGTNSPDFFHSDNKDQHYIVNARAAHYSSSHIKRESAKRLSMHSLSTKEPCLLTPYSAQSLPRESRRKEPLGQDSKSYFDLAVNKNDNYCFNGVTEADEVVIKNEAGPLGLHVVPCYDLLGNDQGLRVERIEPNGRIAKDGQIELHDKIIKINGHNLLHVPFSKVQDIFMSAMNEPCLKISVMKNRKTIKSDKNTKNINYNPNHSNNSKNEAEESLKKVQGSNYNILQTANTRKIGRMIEIELTKGTNGLGFSVTTRDNPAGGHCPIYIKNILPKGAAVEDGRLRPGDRLLEVNKMEMTGKNQAEVVSLLRSIPPGGKVKIVVSRQEEVSAAATDPQLITSYTPRELTVSSHSTESNDNIKYWSTPSRSPVKKKEAEEPEKIEAQHSYGKSNVKGPKHSDDVVLSPRKNRMILTLDIPVHDSEKAGLGVSVKGKTSSTDDNSSVDLGIFIKSVLHGGAASRDGRLRTNDQLLNVNGVSLLGLSNSDAMETLRRAMLNTNSPFTGVITLTIARRVSSYDGCDKIFSDSLPHSRSKTDLINRVYIGDATSKQSENRVREKNDLNSQSDAVDNGQISSTTSVSPWNPVIDRLTEQYNKNSLRNESYCLATNKTWIDPGNKAQKLALIHKEDSLESILAEESNQQDRSQGKKHSEDKDSQYSEDPTYDSQLSLEELNSSGNKFSRDALGRQSMSEKRHAALDAKNTDTYKRNKKLREGREGKTVEAQNQHDPFEDPPTPKKVQSVENFDKIRAKTTSQESNFLEEQKNRQKKIIPDSTESDYLYTIPGRTKFISPRKHWLVDDVQGCLLPLRQLMVQPKRFRGKINIRKPRAPHYERARVMEFVKPYYFSEKRGKSLDELCQKSRLSKGKKQIENPLEQIIAREALNWFNNSRMIAFFHLNPYPTEEKFNFAVALKKHNMHFKFYGRQTLSIALENTPHEAVLQLFTSQNLIVFGQDTSVEQLLKLIRKRPELVLMAGIIDGKFFNKNDFVNYAKLGDLTTVRSGLVQLLQNAAGVNLNRQLSQHQTTLVSRLKQISSPESPEEEI